MTTTDTRKQSLLQAILDEPDDDSVRLVYADWLEEFGDTDDLMRAEFIRVQIKLERRHRIAPREVDTPILPNCLCDWCVLLRRERELLDGVCGLGVEALPVIQGLTRSIFAGRGWYGWNLFCEVPHSPNGIEAVFRRGFVEEITCTAEEWLAHADAIVACCPVRRATLTTHLEWNYFDSDMRIVYFRRDDERRYIMVEELGLTKGDLVSLGILHHEWPGIAFTLPEDV